MIRPDAKRLSQWGCTLFLILAVQCWANQDADLPVQTQWADLTEVQQEILFTVQSQWKQLTPELQSRLLTHVDRIKNVPVEKRDNLVARITNSLLRHDRKSDNLRDARNHNPNMDRHRNERPQGQGVHRPRSPDQRAAMMERFREMSPEEHKRRVESHQQNKQARNDYNPQAMRAEREAMREKMKDMTPEERRAFLEAQRGERRKPEKPGSGDKKDKK